MMSGDHSQRQWVPVLNPELILLPGHGLRKCSRLSLYDVGWVTPETPLFLQWQYRREQDHRRCRHEGLALAQF